ncbi:LysR family transcriptional regulator [Advenella sp. FME57]|nr:LysR family transcriptional regulator [Advenella sp. FME57]
MDEHQLRCFVTVVETGNLSKAARLLNMTQPPLSILIQKLEQSLDVALFNRQKNRLVLSEPGRLFYIRAKDILASFKTLRHDVKNNAAGTEGNVSIGCSTAASLFILPLVMQRIQQERLNITVNVREGESSYILNGIRRNELDVGIIRTRFQSEDLVVRTLITEPLMLTVAQDHPLAARQDVTLVDLAQENFLLHSSTDSNGIREHILEACSTVGFNPKIVYSGNETLPMLMMIERGIGIGFAPKMFEKVFTGHRVKFIELLQPKLTSQLNLVTVKSRAESAVTTRFLKIVAEVLDEKSARLGSVPEMPLRAIRE